VLSPVASSEGGDDFTSPSFEPLTLGDSALAAMAGGTAGNSAGERANPNSEQASLPRVVRQVSPGYCLSYGLSEKQALTFAP
jgi:hypothetical protein